MSILKLLTYDKDDDSCNPHEKDSNFLSFSAFICPKFFIKIPITNIQAFLICYLKCGSNRLMFPENQSMIRCEHIRKI